MDLNRRSLLGAFVVGAISLRTGFAADKKERKDDGEWEKLGEVVASKKEERDVIDVKGKKRFTALRFEVEKGAIELEDIKITFGNDEAWSPETKLVFKEGERSRKIDLPGDAREIKHVRFLYRSVGRGEAVVVVFGKVK
jgi:hypothetical protein